MFPAASPEPVQLAPVKLSAIDKGAAALVVLAYIAVEILLFRLHAPWRDEAQAWLVSQSLSRPLDFLVIPGGEGHPPLWFWLLRGLSTFATFDQARYVTLAVAVLNALLFWRLLHARLLLLVLMLSSSVILFSWGFHFRPYGIVLALVLIALLLDRDGRDKASTWWLALACGFHFFAGFLFGFWLLLQLHRRRPIAGLIGPAILATLFGVSALLSGIGSPASAADLGNLPLGTLYNLAWPLPDDFRQPLAGVAYLVLLVFALHRTPVILMVLLVLTVGFAAGTAVIYGEFRWHAAFMMIMAFMAFVLAGTNARQWVLLLILAPQALVGIPQTRNALGGTENGDFDIYAIVQSDAGNAVIPPRQLVAWPDYMLSSAAAREGFTYRSGNNGTLMGPVNWLSRTDAMIDPGLADLPTPYWLVCIQCQHVLPTIEAAGLQATALGSAFNGTDGHISAYRINGEDASRPSP